MCLLLDDDPGDRRGGQPILQLLPVFAVIDGVIETVTGPDEEHAAPVRVLGDRERVVERVLRGQIP